MCGIFGVMVHPDSQATLASVESVTNKLFRLSVSRGKEAAGLAIHMGNNIHIYKAPVSATAMIKSNEYKNLFGEVMVPQVAASKVEKIRLPFVLFGHSRLATNGIETSNVNNQPVVTSNAVGIHNGIIVNNEELWAKHSSLQRNAEVDSEIIVCLLRKFIDQGLTPEQAVKQTFDEIYGSASVAISLCDTNLFVLATNTGSLYLCENDRKDVYIFASEKYILKKLTEESFVKELLGDFKIIQIRPWHGCLLDILNFTFGKFTFAEANDKSLIEITKTPYFKITDIASFTDETREELRRCKKCVLPETMPMIEFDQNGVCNYCREYEKKEPLGREQLEKTLAAYRRDDGEPDCIVAVSGGRDSCYGLHYIKTELKMHPIAYTYDWGMVTDLARRNQARICGKLGIEHILVSADIKAKRKNIRRNIEAWLKKPELGVIPLFMAGDKQFFYYAKKLRAQTGVKLVFLGSNRLEKTKFKTGFSGIKEGSGNTYNIPFTDKCRLTNYYLKQFLTNPGYLNSSLLDTAFAYFSAYILKHDFVYLYNYIGWEEKKIMSTLTDEYDWEVAGDTKSTWRIGDQTAAFYNYVYYTVAGFTENDTFRSNQIREGKITREEALLALKEDNKPRYDSIREYMSMISVDFDEAISVINSMPKLY